MKERSRSFQTIVFVLFVVQSPFAGDSCRGQESNVRVQTDVEIAMRDGIKLSTNIFLPKAEGEFPAILVRTPYGKGDGKDISGRFYASKGCVYVIQDCRGRGQSKGVWEPFMNERQDGLDMQEWMAAQDWCNRKIGTWGGSYFGFTQWITAPEAEEYVKCMFTMVPVVDPWRDAVWRGGALNMAAAMTWGTGMGEEPTARWTQEDWDRAYCTLPLSDWDKVVGKRIQYLHDWMAHPAFDAYWQRGSVRGQWGSIDVPIMVMGGWYDIFAETVFEHINAVKANSASKHAREDIHLIMGPWTHSMPNSEDGKVGAMDFGEEAAARPWRLSPTWFDYWLLGEDADSAKPAPFRIFVMGRNEWRDEQEWPLARTQFTPWYLHGQGMANSLRGDGQLSTVEPEKEPADVFTYEPDDPVPTLGGCNLMYCPAGPFDQRKAEKRDDVLVYSSEPLKAELEVTGPVKCVLYAASSALDTDWTGKLVDVHPDGLAINLCDGIQRARFRHSMKTPELIVPGKVYRYEIDLGVTSNVFLPGHRIRVEISSSNFPRFDRNLNTGGDLFTDAQRQRATQTIYHESKHPSHIVLPVIPERLD